MRQIKQTRKKGYDVSIGEKIPGVVCIAAPVKHYLYPATLAILGPEYRMDGKIPLYTRELVKSAATISRNVSRYLKKAQTPFRQ